MGGFPTKPRGSHKHRSAARTLVVRQKQGPILLLHGAFPRRRVEKTCLEPSPNPRCWVVWWYTAPELLGEWDGFTSLWGFTMFYHITLIPIQSTLIIIQPYKTSVPPALDQVLPFPNHCPGEDTKESHRVQLKIHTSYTLIYTHTHPSEIRAWHSTNVCIFNQFDGFASTFLRHFRTQKFQSMVLRSEVRSPHFLGIGGHIFPPVPCQATFYWPPSELKIAVAVCRGPGSCD